MSTRTSSTPLALGWLAAAYFAMGTSTLAMIGGLPAIASGLHTPPDAVAHLVAVFAITFAFAAPGAQVVLGHWPRRRILLGGLALAALGTLASALATRYEMLFVARILTALGAAAIGPVASALGASLVPRAEQGRALTTVFLGMTLASVLSVPASTWMSVHFGWRPMLLAVALLDAVVALGVKRSVADGEPAQPIALRDLLALLRRPAMAGAVGVMLLQMAGLFAAYTMIVPLLHEHFGLDDAMVSAALFAFGLAGVLGNLLARRVAARWSAERALAAALLALTGVQVLAWAAPPSAALAFAVLVAWAVANDVFMPSQQRRLVELAPQLRSLALALNASALYSGMSGGSFVAGLVYDHAGVAALPLASAGLMLAALALLQWSRRAAGGQAIHVHAP
ncbi:MAG TPA: MFS transporter [Albitalea sp.]|nr:MFS transporter [Albitalea sp.]